MDYDEKPDGWSSAEGWSRLVAERDAEIARLRSDQATVEKRALRKAIDVLYRRADQTGDIDVSNALMLAGDELEALAREKSD